MADNQPIPVPADTGYVRPLLCCGGDDVFVCQGSLSIQLEDATGVVLSVVM